MIFSQDFLKKQIKMLAENFNKDWFTEQRIDEIKAQVKKLDSTDSEIERAFRYFIRNDKRPTIGLISQRLYSEKQRSKADVRAQKELLNKPSECLECGGTHVVWVRKPDTEKENLTMACTFCKKSDRDWSNFWQLPEYNNNYTLIESPLKQAISKASSIGKLGFGNSVYAGLIRRNILSIKSSLRYFNMKGVLK